MAVKPTMKVLSVVPYRFLPARTGGQIAIAFFNKFLSHKVELHCATIAGNENNSADYFAWPAFSDSKLRYVNVFYFFKLKKYIRKHQITHLIIEHPYLGWLGAMLKSSCKVKFVIRSHNIEGLRWKQLGKWWWRLLYSYEKWAHRRADFNLFITDADKEYAIENFSLLPEKCTTVTFGTEMKTIPAPEERMAARKYLEEKYGISDGETILLFNGAFNYKPNRDALVHLLEKIIPHLLRSDGFEYRLLVCGKDLPADISDKAYPRVIFAGFVDDLLPYLNGSDIFVNPVVAGGGIKTKLVEALAHNLSCVSYASGAMGIPNRVTGSRLQVVDDYNDGEFAGAVLRASETKDETTPSAFFEHFYWENVIERCVHFIAG